MPPVRFENQPTSGGFRRLEAPGFDASRTIAAVQTYPPILPNLQSR
jgi:hypothetical protein